MKRFLSVKRIYLRRLKQKLKRKVIRNPNELQQKLVCSGQIDKSGHSNDCINSFGARPKIIFSNKTWLVVRQRTHEVKREQLFPNHWDKVKE